MAHTRHLIGRLADSGLAKMGSEPREAVSKRRKKKRKSERASEEARVVVELHGRGSGLEEAVSSEKKKKKRKRERASEEARVELQGSTSNWERLKAQGGLTLSNPSGSGRGGKRKEKVEVKVKVKVKGDGGDKGQQGGLTRLLAIDCEMGGAGVGGSVSLLARVSIVNTSGQVVYDTYVSPGECVTDYRTRWSGIRPHHIKNAPKKHEVGIDICSWTRWECALTRSLTRSLAHSLARPFRSFVRQVLEKVRGLVTGRILCGHAIHNDLDVLEIAHPQTHIRDSAKFPRLMREGPGGKLKPKSLAVLAAEELGMAIQDGNQGHCSIQDARATMMLYRKHEREWEKWMRTKARAKTKAKSSTKTTTKM